MKRAIFIDTVYVLALLNPRDRWHRRAVDLSQALRGPFATSHAILIEVADALAQRNRRTWAAEAIKDMQSDDAVTCVSVSSGIFASALQLYEERPDKDWSLTDCISFVVMRQQQLVEALTADSHFTQAGFKALMLEP